MSTNNTSKIVIRLKRVTNNTTSKGTWFKKVINIGKYIGIVIAFLVSITTLYQFTDSFYQKKQNDDTEKLKKFVKAGRKVYYSKAKYDYIAHYPEWPKSFSDKLTEIGLKQDYEQNLSILNIYGDSSNSYLGKVKSNATKLKNNTDAFLQFTEPPTGDTESDEYKKWEKENNERLEKYINNKVKPEEYNRSLEKYETRELEIIDSNTLNNALYNLFLNIRGFIWKNITYIVIVILIGGVSLWGYKKYRNSH